MVSKIKKSVTEKQVEKKTYYAVMKLQKWESIKLESVGQYKVPFPVSLLSPTNGEIGYISVFDSIDNAIKFNNGSKDNICMLQDVQSS
jgi:hypothetical protein